MKELEKLRYFESVLAGTHMLLESMEAKDLHLAFKVVSELQSKIVYLLTRIVHQEAYKSNFPSGSNSFASGRPSIPTQRGREHAVPVISSVNTSRLSLDSRKTSPGRLSNNNQSVRTVKDGDNLMKKRNSMANGVGIFWAMNTFLLPTPDINVSPDPELSNELTRQGFGLSMSSTSDRRQMVNTNCTADELMVQICRRYPRVPALSRVGFTYHYRPSGNQRHLIPITSKMPHDLYSLLGNEGILYLRPKAPLKSIPSRQGPQEPICIDDDDEDASQPAPISTGRRQQPNASPGMSGIRGGSGPMISSSPGGVPGPILQQQRGGPNSAMPPPQMVPGLRTSAPSTAIPLPSMSTQQSALQRVPVSAAIQLPMALSQPSSVPMFSSPASSVSSGPPNSVEPSQSTMPNVGPPTRMNTMPPVQRQPPVSHPPPSTQTLPQHPHPHPQIEVLKIPIEGSTTTPKPLPNDEPPTSIGEPPEKRQAIGPAPIATTINVRRLSNHAPGPQPVKESANIAQTAPETESANIAQQQNPVPNVGGLNTTELINQDRPS